jgi:hypothetical protein
MEITFAIRKISDRVFITKVINDKSDGQQFFPTPTAGTAGLFHVCGLDNRNNAGNPLKLEVYATFTGNNGASLSRNARVTEAPFATDGTAVSIGDYIGIAASRKSAHPVWNDGSVNQAMQATIRTARLTVP